MLYQFCREARAVQERAEAAMALAADHESPLWAGWARVLWGWALAQQGLGEAGTAQIHQGLDAYRATGAAMDQPYLLALLAEAHQAAGQIKEGLGAVREALAVASRTGERYYEAELHRLEGELLLSLSAGTATQGAKACFTQALEVARRQRARSLELRAGISLGRLWQKQGKKQQARQMLAEIYAWFTEGFDTADLQHANVLLQQLAR